MSTDNTPSGISLNSASHQRQSGKDQQALLVIAVLQSSGSSMKAGISAGARFWEPTQRSVVSLVNHNSRSH